MTNQQHGLKQDLDKSESAYSKNSEFYNENDFVLSNYSRKIINIIKFSQYRSAMSLGIGHSFVIQHLVEECNVPQSRKLLQRYVIVEGSQKLVQKLKSEMPRDMVPFCQVLHSLFETFEPKEQFDLIEMGFILEHVDDPLLLLRKYKHYLTPDGSMVIAVPNARSLHRLIAYNAGLLEDLYKLSPYDLKVGHQRYFDMDTLVKMVLKAGLKIVSLQGIFLKPFKTAQLKSLELAPGIMRALCSVAENYPEIANIIFLQAKI